VFGRDEGDAQRDDYFYRKLAKHSDWMTNEHLDLKSSPDLTKASKELIRIDLRMTPTDKLDCLVKSIHCIQQEYKTDSIVADDLLPIVILLLIHTNPPRLHSSLQYILRFWMGSTKSTHSNAHVSNEAEYCLTTFLAAMAFVERMHANTFHMSEESYSELCDDKIAWLNKELLWNDSEHIHSTSTTTSNPQLMEIVKLTANKSIASVRKFMKEAEDVVRSTINNLKEGQGGRHPANQHHCQHHQHQGEVDSEEDDEYQMQLAMALSLSALDCADSAASDMIREREEGQQDVDPPPKDNSADH
jgi:VPS9-like protein